MAKRTAQTLAKRQRETARRERQQRKSAKKLERKQRAGDQPLGGTIDWGEAVNAEAGPDVAADATVEETADLPV